MVLLENRVFGLLQNPDEHFLRQPLQGTDDGQPAQEFRNHAEVSQILHRHLRKDVRILVIFVLQLSAEAHGGLLCQTLLDHILQVRERASADEQNVFRVHRGQRHHGIFAVGAHRNLHLAALQQLEHSLLHGFPAHVPGSGVFLLRDLINLIYEDNAFFRPLHVVVRGGEQFGNHAFNIVSDVSRLRQAGRVRNGKRHIQKPCEGLHQIGFSGTGGPDHEDVGLFNLNIVHGVCRYTLIVIINRHGNDLFRLLLTDHVLVQAGLDLVRGGNIFNVKNRLLSLFLILRLLFDLLFVRNSAGSLQIRQVHKADVGVFSILIHVVEHVHELRIVQKPLIIILAHRVHGAVHAVLADADIVGKVVHLSRLAFRPAADEAHVLVFRFLIVRLSAVLIRAFPIVFRRLFFLRISFGSLLHFSALIRPGSHFLFIFVFSIFKIVHLRSFPLPYGRHIPCFLKTVFIIKHGLLTHK